MRRVFAGLMALLAAGHAAAGEFQRAAWEGRPIPLHLRVGVEKEVRLQPAADIEVGLPAALDGKISALSAAGAVWLEASKAFSEQKIFLRSPGLLVILAVEATTATATDAGVGKPLVIAAKRGPAPAAASGAGAGACERRMIDLARHALRELYAPARLAQPDPCLQPIEADSGEIDLFACREGRPLCAGGVIATPVASWRAKRYIHALRVQNMLKSRVRLDPRDIRGDFQAATIAHHRLGPAGGGDDTTAVVLISRWPLAESLAAEHWRRP